MGPRNGVLRGGIWLRLALFGACVVASLESPGCGGIMVDSTSTRDGGTGSEGFGGSGGVEQGGVGTRPVGSGGKTDLGQCGNGQIDFPETCDGVNLNGATCASATMGTRPVGSVRCSSNCKSFDTRGCGVTGGRGGSGGVTGVGGFFGAGGYFGTGGTGSAAACYESGGVPSGMGSCAYGYVASEECQGRVGVGGSGGDCTQGCGCKACPAAYTRCLLDGGCAFIFGCAEQAYCTSLKDCYATSCGSIIDRAGGPGSSGARFADALFTCLSQNGCPTSCGSTGPPPPGP